MSINYRHEVDIPVTDIEDPEDDIVFAEYHRDTNEFLDGLDYELPKTDPNGIIAKLKSMLTSKGYSKRTNDYEMLSYRQREEISTPSFDSDDFNKSVQGKYEKDKLNIKNIFILVGAIITCGLLASFYFKILSMTSTAAMTILSNSTHNFFPTTIVVSLDGFHPHYISSHLTPTLHNMLVYDFGAPYMIPSFPSSTFPNHWTLVTGLYPSEHGIVGNTFFDPKLNKQFVNTNPKLGGLDPDFWQGGEPIWTTAQRQGVKAAVHMWPGSEVPGVGPKTDFDRYNGSELLTSKVEKLMKWIDREDEHERPQLMLTYVPTIDLYGHKYGIHGPNMTKALSYVDNFVALLQSELKARNLDDIVNLVFLSDHGMAPTSNDRLIYLDDLVDMTKIEHVDGWPNFGLRTTEEYNSDEVYLEIKEALSKSPQKDGYDVYKVEEIPEEYEFGGTINRHKFNYRLAPIWIIPRVGYSVTTHKQMEELGGDYKPKGVHGYNNTEILMRALFLGRGPYFKNKFQNHKVEPFANTEVYNMICDSLNLKPSPNNGTNSFQFLDSTWKDDSAFPGLSFEVQHLVENATYDMLWRPNAKPQVSNVGTNSDPLESMIVAESIISSMRTVHMPKPTDFENNDNHPEVDVETFSATSTNSPASNLKDDPSAANFVDEILSDVGDFIEDTIHDIGEGFTGLSGWLKGLGSD